MPSPTPLLLAGLRALIGGAVLAAWLPIRSLRRAHGSAGHTSGGAASWRHWLPAAPLLLGLAVANATLAFGAMYLAAGRTGAALASILTSGQPVVLAVAGWALFDERASRRTVAGIGAALLGVVLITATRSGATGMEGVALALLAMAAPAAGTVLMRWLGASIDVVATTSAQFLIGGAILIVVSAVLEPWDVLRWSPTILAGLVILGVLGTGVAYGAWFWLLNRMSLVRLGSTLFLVPITGVVAAIGSGERPQPVALLGIAAVLAGIVSIGLPGRAAEAPPAGMV